MFLKDVLNKLTMTELVDISARLKINKYSKMNREDIISSLLDFYYSNLKLVLFKLDNITLELLKQIIKLGGKADKDAILSEASIIHFLSSLCLVYPNEKELFIPEDLIEPIKKILEDLEIKKKIDDNSNIIFAITGMLRFYGCIYLNRAKEILNKMTDKNIDLMDTVKNSFLLCDTVKYVEGEKSTSSYLKIASIQDDMAEVILKNQADQYKKFILKEYIKAGSVNYVSAEGELRYIFEDFIISEEIFFFLADYIFFSLNYNVKNADLLQEICNKLEFSDDAMKNLCMIKLQNYFKNVPRWVLGGYTPNEQADNKESNVLNFTPKKGATVLRFKK